RRIVAVERLNLSQEIERILHGARLIPQHDLVAAPEYLHLLAKHAEVLWEANSLTVPGFKNLCLGHDAPQCIYSDVYTFGCDCNLTRQASRGADLFSRLTKDYISPMTVETALPVTLSARAAKRIAEILKSEPTPTNLRLAVTGGGCSGFQYNFALDDQRM